MDRSDQETKFYERINRGDRFRIGAAFGILAVIAFGVAVAVAASPSPGASDGSLASASPSVSTAPTDTTAPTATTAPAATAAPGATTAPDASGAPDDKNGPGHAGWGFGRFGFGGPGFGGRGSGSVFGPITITAIDGTSVSLKTADGWTRTIVVDGSVKVTKGGADATASDLKVGDEVRLRQTKETDGSFTVTSIDIVLPTAFGEVTATTADTITIKRPDGTTSTIHVGSGTTYRVAGVDNATLADVDVGSFVIAQGTQRSDGSLDATTVASGFGPRMFKDGHGPGPGGPFAPGGPKPNASPGASTAPG